MKSAFIMREAIVMALAFIGLQLFQAYLLKDALAKQERASAHRLCAGVAGVLNTAHRAKDDLLLYQVLGALENSPGVVEARLVNLEAKAHVEPGSYTYALKDGSQKWGSLVLSLSDRPNQRLVRRLWLSGTAAAAFLWSGLIFYWRYVEKRTASLRDQVAELQGILETEKRKRQDAEKREHIGALQSSAWLEVALAHISRPLVLLDSRQRLTAANTSAAVLLGAAQPRDLSGKSWQDVRGLSACGPLLAESLEMPGHPVRKRNGSSGHMMEFLTMDSNEGLLGGTWVRFLEVEQI